MKRLFLFIFDPPWLLLIFGWPVFIIIAFIYAWPANMDEYGDAAPTPEMRLAVLREIRAAEQRVVLEFASGVLKRVVLLAPDAEGRAGITRAQEKIRDRIAQAAQPAGPIDDGDTDNQSSSTDKPSSTDKSASTDKSPSTDKPSSADKPAGDGSSASPPAKPQDKRSSKRSRSSRNRNHPGFGIEVNDKGDLHVDLGFVDRSLAMNLEAKYGKGPLPAVDAEVKQAIYDGVKQRIRHFVQGVLAVVLLILTFPLFVLSKILVSIVRAFSNRAARSDKVAQENSLARQLTEARLAAMQAQIEPHFLFNTMASVQQLIETDPAAAAKMQTNLIKYLRGAVPQMRENTSTLAREVELSTAYLDILKIRMEDRLTYAIDVPPELMGAAFPPMMLPTLVENAIKHGLEPLTGGGEVRITAVNADAKLRVTVADTGMGFADQPGKGVGLANVRERLAAMYGKNAQLIVEPNQPRGARFTIEIPLPGPR
jgi:hypothetical protein